MSRFSPHNLFPPFAAGRSGAPSAPSAADLGQALAAFLGSDPAIAEAAKAWNREAPGTQAQPFVAFAEEETATLATFKRGCRVETVVVRFYCRAPTAAAAKALAAVVKGRLVSSPSYAPARLLFAGGREIGRYSHGPDSTFLDPDRGPRNEDAWGATFPVTFKVARG